MPVVHGSLEEPLFLVECLATRLVAVYETVSEVFPTHSLPDVARREFVSDLSVQTLQQNKVLHLLFFR